MRRLPFVVLLLIGAASRARTVEQRIVVYEIGGTAKYADVTWNNGAGATEQRRMKFPVRESFYMPLGSTAYIAAQKTVVRENRGFGESQRPVPRSNSTDLELIANLNGR